MIKIISYVVIAFSTGNQIFYVGGLIFYAFSTGTKACVTAENFGWRAGSGDGPGGEAGSGGRWGWIFGVKNVLGEHSYVEFT